MMKKIADIETIADLGLPEYSQDYLQAFPPKELVKLAREGRLRGIHGVGKRQAKIIMKALREAGYISLESTRSLGARRIIAAARAIPDFGSMDEYESRKELTEEQIAAVMSVMEEVLNWQENRIMVMLFGLGDDGKIYTLRECGDEFNIRREKVQSLRSRAFKKLRRYSTKRRLQEILYPPETGVLIGDGPDVKGLARILANSNQRHRMESKIEPTPIEQLNLSLRTYNCLRMAGLTTVESIQEKTREELSRVRNLTWRGVEEVVGVLAELGVDLEE